MKRIFKTIALCLAVMALTVLFTGCDYIDELRADHAVLSSDKQSIVYNGELYKRLPDITEEESYYWNSHIYNINVTDNDVPVLLSDTLCHYSNYDKHRDIITVDFSDVSFENNLMGYSVITIGFDARYCNVKDYNRYTENIKNNKADRIGFVYNVYDDKDFYTTIEAGSEVLSKEILAHVKNNEKMTTDAYDIITEDLYSESLFNVMLLCDEYAVNVSVLEDGNYTIERSGNGEAYLIDQINSTAVKLSEEATAELKYEYFSNIYTGEVEYIGSSDTETDVFLSE